MLAQDYKLSRFCFFDEMGSFYSEAMYFLAKLFFVDDLGQLSSDAISLHALSMHAIRQDNKTK